MPLPASDSATASARKAGMRSRSTSSENNAIQIGLVVTRATLLATDVYSSETIHDAKCAARNTPAAAASHQSRRDSAANSVRERSSTSGMSSSAASAMRQAAMASEGTPWVCAKRTRIDAVETIKTPPPRTA